MSNVTGPGTAQDRNRLFEQLVDRYQEPVLRMCYYCLCDKTQAEDAAQETFLKLYRTLDNYRGDCSEKTWIMKIATRVCYDMNHSGWFRFMNYKLREVILLYYYQGMNVNEIADALNLSHSSVSGRLKRGREKLKKMLEGRELDE